MDYIEVFIGKYQKSQYLKFPKESLSKIHPKSVSKLDKTIMTAWMELGHTSTPLEGSLPLEQPLLLLKKILKHFYASKKPNMP